jgi:hypothetical protein
MPIGTSNASTPSNAVLEYASGMNHHQEVLAQVQVDIQFFILFPSSRIFLFFFPGQVNFFYKDILVDIKCRRIIVGTRLSVMA